MENYSPLNAIQAALRRHPGSSAAEIAAATGREKSSVNSLLYAYPRTFYKLQGSPPVWYLTEEEYAAISPPRTLTARERQILANYDVEVLYSLQDIRNLESIEEHGILSRNRMADLGIRGRDLSDLRVQRTRWDRIIEGRPLHDFVPLFLRPLTPMQFRVCVEQKKRDQVALVEVDVAVFGIAGMRFTDGNARQKSSRVLMHLSELETLDWDILNTPNAWSPKYKHKKSAEVLIPDCVPAEYIRAVVATTGCSLPPVSMPCFEDDSLFPNW